MTGLASLLFAFSVTAQSTDTFSFMNLDRPVPDGSGSGLSFSTNLTSTIGSVAAARVRLKVTGEYNGDLYAYLRHVTPKGTSLAVLLNRPGRSTTDTHGYDGAGMDVTLASSAVADIHLYGNFTNLPNGVALSGSWQPDARKVNPNTVGSTSTRDAGLDVFLGMEGSGEWTLFVADLESGGSNMLSGWELELVGGAVPTVTWPRPADVVYGTPLGAAQLNASSSVPGSFSYNPPAGTILDAGSFQLLTTVFTPTDTVNYQKSTNTALINVQRKPLTITADNKSKVYGAAAPGLSVTYAGFVPGQTNTVLTTQPTLSTAVSAATPVGSYAITVSGAASANYLITHVNGTLTVTPAALTITADNKTKLYGAALPALSASYNGFVNGDTAGSLSTPPSLTTTATAASPVATYSITATGAAAANYAISYVPGTLSVTPAALTITADNKTKLYGAALPVLSASYSGFVNGDTAGSLTTPPSLTTTATAASPVATYSITATGAAAANYAISFVPGTLSVTPAALTIAADNKAKLYGAALPALSASYSGFVNGDTAGSLTTPPSLTTTATVASPVGTYPITATGAAAANYTISYAPGTLAIGAASSVGSVAVSRNPAVPGQAVTLSYSLGSVPPASGTPTGTVRFKLDGSTLANATLVGGVASFTTSTIGFGTHVVTAEYAGDGNYLGVTNALGSSLVVNTPPTAVADAVTRYPTNGLKISIASLLANDVESDSTDSIHLASTASTSVLGGTVVSNGVWLFYTSPAGNTNTDRFSYTIADTLGGISEGTVTITTVLGTGPSLAMAITNLNNGNYQIRFDGIPNTLYDIETTPTLNPANWQLWLTKTTDADGMILVTDPVANGAPNKFYRTVYKP